MRAWRVLFAITNLVTMMSSTSIVSAQTWPAKPIKIVLGFPPGGATDILSRDFAAKLGEELKQQVIIENKPGAGGTIGADIVAEAAPDGYTLTIGNSSNHAIAVSLYKKLPYNPVTDFVPIAMLADAAFNCLHAPENTCHTSKLYYSCDDYKLYIWRAFPIVFDL